MHKGSANGTTPIVWATATGAGGAGRGSPRVVCAEACAVAAGGDLLQCGSGNGAALRDLHLCIQMNAIRGRTGGAGRCKFTRGRSQQAASSAPMWRAGAETFQAHRHMTNMPRFLTSCDVSRHKTTAAGTHSACMGSCGKRRPLRRAGGAPPCGTCAHRVLLACPIVNHGERPTAAPRRGTDGIIGLCVLQLQLLDVRIEVLAED